MLMRQTFNTLPMHSTILVQFCDLLKTRMHDHTSLAPPKSQYNMRPSKKLSTLDKIVFNGQCSPAVVYLYFAFYWFWWIFLNNTLTVAVLNHFFNSSFSRPGVNTFHAGRRRVDEEWIVWCFCCLGVFAPLENFSLMDTSLLPVKGYKLLPSSF